MSSAPTPDTAGASSAAALVHHLEREIAQDPVSDGRWLTEDMEDATRDMRESVWIAASSMWASSCSRHATEQHGQGEDADVVGPPRRERRSLRIHRIRRGTPLEFLKNLRPLCLPHCTLAPSRQTLCPAQSRSDETAPVRNLHTHHHHNGSLRWDNHSMVSASHILAAPRLESKERSLRLRFAYRWMGGSGGKSLVSLSLLLPPPPPLPRVWSRGQLIFCGPMNNLLPSSLSASLLNLSGWWRSIFKDTWELWHEVGRAENSFHFDGGTNC